MTYQRMYVLMLDAHIPMFDGALIVNDENRLALMYWCKYYNSYVFSADSKDRPDDFTVNCDILMDEWVKKLAFKENIQASNPKGFRTADDMQSVITFDT